MLADMVGAIGALVLFAAGYLVARVRGDRQQAVLEKRLAVIERQTAATNEILRQARDRARLDRDG